MGTLAPRIVIVTRESEYERLLARHATHEAARFHLTTRDQSIEPVMARHAAQEAAVRALRAALPRAWRQAAVRRSELDRFAFAPDDIVAAIGQDGLIANVAKYVGSQPVIGINPDPAAIAGVLARIAVDAAADVLAATVAGRAAIDARTMVEAELDTGERLFALNEIFVGHRSHQSALYELSHGDARERQSSSGVIIASGTGASGWARSIMTATGRTIAIDPCQPMAAYFVREAWPSPTTGSALVAGTVARDAPLFVTSRMDGGTIFADGMEQDYLRFDWGQQLSIRPAQRRLTLVTGMQG